MTTKHYVLSFLTECLAIASGIVLGAVVKGWMCL